MNDIITHFELFLISLVKLRNMLRGLYYKSIAA